jgi:hypothetical protein
MRELLGAMKAKVQQCDERCIAYQKIAKRL